jgi:hypothetical protein
MNKKQEDAIWKAYENVDAEVPKLEMGEMIAIILSGDYVCLVEQLLAEKAVKQYEALPWYKKVFSW